MGAQARVAHVRSEITRPYNNGAETLLTHSDVAKHLSRPHGSPTLADVAATWLASIHPAVVIGHNHMAGQCCIVGHCLAKLPLTTSLDA